MDNFFAEYPPKGGVTSLNGLTGALTLVAGTGISIVPAGSNITITNTSPGSPSSGVAGAVQISDGVGGFNSDAANFFFNTTTHALEIGDGTVSTPSLAFVNETSSGLFRIGSQDFGMSLGGTQFFETRFVSVVGHNNINVAFGPAGNISTDPDTPFVATTDFSGGIGNFVFTNTNTNFAAASAVVVGAGLSPNFTTLENWAYNTNDHYLGGGSALFASPNQTQFIIGVEQNSFIGFTVGGRTANNEIIRLTSASLLPTTPNATSLGIPGNEWTQVNTHEVLNTSGNLTLLTPAVTSTPGNILVTAGAASSGAQAGNINLTAGDSTGASTFSGNVVIKSGNNANAGFRAPIVLESDNAIQLIAGPDITALPLQFYNSATTNFTALQADNTMTVSTTFTLPKADGTSGQVMTTNGAGILSFSTIASGANTALSNLAATAVNVSISPGVSDSIDLGGSGNQWANIYLGSVSGTGLHLFNSITEMARVNANITSPSGVTSAGILGNSTSAGIVLLATDSNATANATATANVLIESGNKTAGTGNSGDISLTIGTSSGGTRGHIKFVDGSEGTAGQVWTSTDTSGHGHWAPASTGFTPVNATIQDNSGQSIPNGTLTTYKYNTTIFDSASAYNNSTGVYTIPTTGKYFVSATISTASTFTFGTGEAIGLEVAQNGTTVLYGQLTGNGGTNSFFGNAVGAISCTAGDSVIVRFFNDAATSTTASTNQAENTFSIYRIA